jgi:putative acetyltransferase
MIILINAKEYLADFIRLNETWIKEYFQLEDADRQLSAKPDKIIEDGGYVFTLLENREVVGVCALFKDKDNTFQLARMAVSKVYQGQGYGNALLEAALAKLVEIKAEKVYLLSNTRLVSAISLYKKHGFNITHEGLHPMYARVDIVMERSL